MSEQSLVGKAIEISRELDPELWEKVDRIAEMIDPGAFGRWHNTTNPDAEPMPLTPRQEYMQAAARNKAWMILQYLGEAPEDFDWMPIFERLHDTPEPTP